MATDQNKEEVDRFLRASKGLKDIDDKLARLEGQRESLVARQAEMLAKCGVADIGAFRALVDTSRASLADLSTRVEEYIQQVNPGIRDAERAISG